MGDADMITSKVSLNSRTENVSTSAGVLNQPLADDRFYSEQFLADLTDQHIQTLRVARRRDAEEGTPGKRTPAPTWISERAVRYQGRAIKAWQAKRTEQAAA